MKMAMDIDTMLATKNVIERPISVRHLTLPPFAITILRGEASRIAIPGSPLERRKRPWPVCPPRLAVPAKLGYQMDVNGQTLADCGLPCAGDSSTDAFRSSTGSSAQSPTTSSASIQGRPMLRLITGFEEKSELYR